MTTKKKISEQIQRIYSRFLDKENISDVIDYREILLLVEQSINKVLKLQVSESFSIGEIEVPRCNLLEYTVSTINQDTGNSRAYIDLPAIPLTLPLDMGVYSISATNSALQPYIPIPSQDMLVFGTIASGANVSFLEGQVGYYVQGKRVYFTKDITLTANGGVTSVVVVLLVMDFSKFSDNEMLPISPEIENTVITDVLANISNGRISQAEITVGQ